MSTDLKTEEAQALFEMPKIRVDETIYYLGMGDSFEIPLLSADRTEQFILGVSRGGIDIKKATYNNRYQKVYTLARLDISGPDHRNPDGERMPCPHLHLYREGFGDRWAVRIDPAIFSDTTNLARTLEEFMLYCNIVELPAVQVTL